jgi:hypothetical protein
MQGRRYPRLPAPSGDPKLSKARLGALRRSDLQRADLETVSAPMAAGRRRTAAETPFPRDAGAEVRPEQRSGKTRKQVSSSSCPAAERRKGIPRRGRNGRSRIRSWCDWMRCWLAGTRLPGEPSGQTPLLAVVLVGGRLGGAARAVHSAASTSTPHSQQPRVPEVGMPVERLPIDVAAGLMRPIWTASRPREERR